MGAQNGMLETMETNRAQPNAGRPGFPEIYLSLAFSLAERSTCKRLKVGTVITSTDYRKVLAVGYNGNASGLPNACDRDEAGRCGCLHSEENAVINCDSPRHMEKFAFVTHLPCVMCAKRLINLGTVKRVYYCHEYRSQESLAVFKAVGIEFFKLDFPKIAVQVAGGTEL